MVLVLRTSLRLVLMVTMELDLGCWRKIRRSVICLTMLLL